MATLLLSAAGTALGGPIGGAIGALIGSAIDQTAAAALTQKPHHEGPRLTSVDITASTEGTAVARLAGRSRMAGQMVWATRFQELAVTTDSGGKGLGGSSTTQYSYYANFAVALCEGPVARIGRIWADGREVDHDYGDVVIRKYLGTEDQDPDSLIEAKEGVGKAPSYRGIAYVVFESMLLSQYGNRMPIITAEVFRSVGDLEPLVRSVAMIPGTTEFGYDPLTLGKTAKQGTYVTENRTTKVAVSDFVASLDMLEELAPGCGTVMLVVAWFGTDLRCGSCEIVPKVENREKVTVYYAAPYPWVVAGLNRLTAGLVSQIDGKPAFGGSPNDASVIAAIQEIRSRGLKVMLYPFVIMDVAAGNALPNPYSDNAAGSGQAVYPWRGRIACSPAPGYAGSPDRTASAASQVSDFVGSATAAHFAGSSGFTVAYSGPAEWRYRRFILHMATLADLAGGVDAFTIGSEMVGLTTVRDGSGYPFVDELIDLASEVRSIVGPATRVSYAADWSEYHSHRPDDGSGDVHFHLDPLWADDDIDFIGIDNYLPVADWRDGTDHLDYDNSGPTSIYELEYLKANIEGGEYYDWYYASAADRDSQTRTDITDGAYGKPWVFRNKDIRNWWANAHHDRPAGAESVASTDWIPASKPVWFTELGCPAVDKGPNQPNVFHDPKSSESFLPHYSTGTRDDAAQRAYLQAVLEYWAHADNNPLSGVYGDRMIDMARTSIWAWDARMAPSFPQDGTAWADAENWDRGHWISGRLGAAPARETISDLLSQYGFTHFVTEAMAGVVDGVIVDRVLSARGVVEALSPAYLLQAFETEGKLRFRSLVGAPVIAELAIDDLVDADGASGADRFQKTRAQETELPDVLKLSYGEPASDDQPGGVEARRTTGGSRRVSQLSLPVVMGEATARAVAETLLHDAWASRERLELSLPPSLLALDPGDVIRFTSDGALGAETFRISEIADGVSRRLRAGRTEASLYAPAALPRRSGPSPVVPSLGTPLSVFLDGPLLRDSDDETAGYIAAYVSPWPGSIAFYRSPEDTGFALDTTLPSAAQMGELAFDFYSGPVWRWDRVGELYVDLYSGTLASASEMNVLAGANALAIETADGEWEIVQFRTAELIDTDRYRLTMLLRGQRGTEHAMRDPVAAGARVLVLNSALGQPDLTADDVGLPLNWRIGPANRDVSDPSFDEKTITMVGKGRRPLAPANLRGKRHHSSGDWRLTWTRRTRIGGDSWNQTEVPVGEEAEAYTLEILDVPGGSVLRTVALTEPQYLYTAAQQTTDFGSVQWNIPMRVAQVSATFGAGVAAEVLTYDY